MKNWKIRLLPVPVTLVLTMFLWVTRSASMAQSFLIGAVVCWLGEFVFGLLLIPKIKAKRAKGFIVLFYIAELSKLAVYGFSFVGAVIVLHQSILPLLLGFIINLVLFWLLSFNALGSL